ncbi:uncharacterized protein LOC131660235 isoform X2 [Vicia villosa]|uniref:uncharacterized protein LOC131660235 isoform X2 n=1 Tax=Vicia villosa TaxID=3911 RepID=UPI00273C70F3|nr:uncharacterized protein LOC131660235 isoform X2 [Vicia villosa]
MGACATFSPWTREDDLLLKNSVESGASLEALAKGAVQFSRKYSIGEIKERWHSIFFDAVVSSEASAAMIRLKEQDIVSVKRKPVRPRDSYYAMRKRMRREAQTSMDFNFLVEPENEDYAVNGDQSLPLNFVPEGSTWNQFPNHDTANYGLPENIMDADVAVNGVTDQVFYTGVGDTLGENFLIGQNHMPEEEHQIFQDNVPLNGAAEEVGVPIDLDIENFIRDEDVEEIPLSSFHPINNNPANLCSEFDEDYLFDSSELECGDSFDDIQLSSLHDIPGIPDWRTEEHGGIPCHGSKDSTACEDGYLKELSNDLLTFTGEEELYLMDYVEKDGIGKSYYDGLSSLLVNSPIDGSSDQIPETDGAELSLIPPEEVKNSCVPRHTHKNDSAGTAETDLLAAFDAHVNDLSASRGARAEVDDKSDFQMPISASAKVPQFPEIVNGVIICKTNTEDPEIPSNDDASLPFNEPPPTNFCSSEPAVTKSNKPVPSSVNDCGYRASRRGKVLMQVEQKNSTGAHVSSQTTGSQMNSGPVSGSKIKCELPNNHSSHTMSKSAAIASGGLGGGNSLTNKTHAALHAIPKEKLVNASSEPNVALPVEDNNLQHAEMGFTEVLRSELVVNPEKFDEEYQYIESDDDIPYYSDIEAMILDMDLEPDVQDLYENEEVSRYQHEETKRTIIRLEQGVHSSTQRAMALHGALALLYGRHSNYYIKKPEVLLGRATEGVHVDIDLGKGGGTNLISRRQAIIKMDKDGSFYIKNIGKSSMLVNNRELHTDQSQRLLSHHLIELKGMQLIFEINQSCMKQ